MHKLVVKILGLTVALILPWASFAQSAEPLCSKVGYTIATVNGINTTETEASNNLDALTRKVKRLVLREPVKYRYLYNETSGAILDGLDAIRQKTFNVTDTNDPDFRKIWKDASAKVTTQKLLLVAHSQGNFYANDLYRVVVGNNDLSTESIGVYSVATPAAYVAGDGEHLTSSTDNMIAGYLKNGTIGGILEPNIRIDYLSSDDSGLGHSFEKVYLNYKSERIVNDIKLSLAKLEIDQKKSENTLCINPPTELPKTSSVLSSTLRVAAVVDSVGISLGAIAWNGILAYPRALATSVSTIGNVVIDTTVGAFVASYNTYEGIAVWIYHAGIATGNAIIDGTLAVGGAIGSFASDAVSGLFSGEPIPANGNTASAIGALQNPPQSSQSPQSPQSTQTPPTNTPSNNPIAQRTLVAPQELNHVPSQNSQPQTEKTASMPKLVFVGAQNQVLSFGGSSPYQAPAVVEELEPVHEEIPVAHVEPPIPPQQLFAPTLTVPQCAYSLATDGCLLATTTVRFEWSSVVGVDHYEISKNGTIATTTDTFTDIIVRDFSPYTFTVSTVDAGGIASATSTQTVFVATIPVAINEIAWMGTNASISDEWFEIKNNSPYTIDLTQWELNAKDGTPHVKLTGTIAPHEYLIFERTDDTAVSDVSAHKIYKGDIGNAGEQLNLSYASTTLDQTPEIIDGAWAAGENGTSIKKTMERYSSREDGADPTNWGTNLGYVKNGTDANGDEIDGTPGAQNSVSTLINHGEDITSDLTITADEERYIVARETYISASSTLTIEPGVTIIFHQEPEGSESGFFYVSGAIAALGEDENPVTFKGDSLEDHTGGMYFGNTSATSTFGYAHFETLSAFDVEDSSVSIKDSEFVSTGGVWAYGDDASLLIENTAFSSSTAVAIGVHSGASAAVSSSWVTNQLDDSAIEVSGGNLVITGTTLDNLPGGSGINAYASTISISSSTIRNARDSAISLEDSLVVISDTMIESGDLDESSNGIDIEGGETTILNTSISGFSDGIGVYIGGSPETPVIITEGEITGNGFGVTSGLGEVNLVDVSVHDNGVGPEDDVVEW